MKKKIGLSMTISLMAMTAAVTFILTFSFSQKLFNQKVTEITRLSEKYERLEELDKKIREQFYKDVPDEDLIDSMLAGYVRGLGDPYSTYRSNKEMEAYEDNNAGVYTGIGISVQKQADGEVLIVSVTDGGSAQKKGISAGDYLVAVEGLSVKDNYAEAIDKIAGEENTKVSVTIRKKDSGNEITYALRRIQIDEQTVQSDLLKGHIGYIGITKFRTVTVEQFEKARKALLKQGADCFIFDVRNNGGGVVSALEKLADPLLPEGELAFAYNKNGKTVPILKSDKSCMEMPYVVLVNGSSASAAELFACLLRDYSGALLVGEKTYGKGIMQTTFQLSGGGVTLTTATYATGVTPCYHETGLEPDILSVLDPEATTDTQLADAVTAIETRFTDTDEDAA